MQRILRLLAPLTLLLAALALVACGGDSGSGDTGGESVGSDESAQTILNKTFASGDKKVTKGKLDIKVNANVSGGSSSVSGPIDIELSGPFVNRGKGKVPALDMDLTFTGAGQNIKGSLTSTGDKAFIGFNGQDYAVDDATFKQFADQLKKQPSSGLSFGKLGLKPATWFKDPKNEGDSKVGDTDTVKVSATQLNLDNIVRDLNALAAKAPSLGLGDTFSGGGITEKQKQQLEDAVKGGSVEIETGKDDSILRRFHFKINVEQDGQKADADVDISLTDLGEDQEIKAPTNTKPLADLLGSLGGLGGLGGLGSSGGGSGAATATPGSASSKAAEKYAKCINDAGSDTSKVQDCAKLLTP